MHQVFIVHIIVQLMRHILFNIYNKEEKLFDNTPEVKTSGSHNYLITIFTKILIKNFFSVTEISNKAELLFVNQFTQKLFRQQLAFHKDISYSEEVEYIIPNPPTEQEIKDFLIDKALNIYE